MEQTLTTRLTRFLPSRTTLDLRAELGIKSYLRPDEKEFFGEDGDQALVQGLGGLKLAQSLGRDTGLQLEYTRQHSFTGQSRFIRDLLYDTDDELFNDRYSYQGQTLGLTLKHLGRWATRTQLRGQLGSRDYIQRLALDLDGVPLGLDQTRRDRWQSLEAELVRPFQPSRGPALELTLHWLYRRTSSNDPYYDAGANTYSTGLQCSF